MSQKSRLAFTQIELLVCLAIISIIVALLLTAVQKVREAASRTRCVGNLKQLTTAAHCYHDTYGKLPNASTMLQGSNFRSTGLSFAVSLLPFIEQSNLYKRFNYGFGPTDPIASYLSEPNKTTAAISPTILICPSSSSLLSLNTVYELDPSMSAMPTMHYVAIMGPKGTNTTTGAAYHVATGGTQGGFGTEGLLSPAIDTRIVDIKDGASNTILFGELSWVESNGYRAWSRGCSPFPSSQSSATSDMSCAAVKNVSSAIGAIPYNGWNNFNDISLGSEHIGGCNVAMCDGSIRYVLVSTKFNILLSLSSRGGAEVVTEY